MEGRDGKGGGGRRERETREPGIDDLAVHQRSVGRGSKRVRKFKPRRRGSRLRLRLLVPTTLFVPALLSSPAALPVYRHEQQRCRHANTSKRNFFFLFSLFVPFERLETKGRRRCGIRKKCRVRECTWGVGERWGKKAKKEGGETERKGRGREGCEQGERRDEGEGAGVSVRGANGKGKVAVD